jgi:maleylacetoacetate isomerase
MLTLYAYWRSSASYRVRIALQVKGIAHHIVPVHLVRDGGEQHGAAYRSLNPQQRVPLLVDGDFKIGQSLAILDYLDARFPPTPLLPGDALQRARVLEFCHVLAADVQPLQNIGVLNYLRDVLKVDEPSRNEWVRHWINRAMTALEAMVADQPLESAVFGNTLSAADCCLVPQLYAARRFGADLSLFPRLAALAVRLEALPAFIAAHPEQQPDAKA